MVALGNVSSVPGISIEAYVVAEPPPAVPAGWQSLAITLSGALPSEQVLGDGWTIILIVPSGSAQLWLAADPAALVATSAADEAAADPASPPGPIGAPRLIARRNGGAPLGAIPLVVGVTGRVWSADGGPGSLLEVTPISWSIPVAALVDGSSPRAQLALAWRTQFPTTVEAVP